MRLCSSDPLCAEHQAGKDGTTLHGASCHACLFAPETSCERGNKYLDRSVLVPTVDQDAYAFFDPPDGVGTRKKKRKKKDDDNKPDSDVVDLFDLLSTEVTEATARIKLPKDIQQSLKLPSQIAEFRFLNADDEMPKKNTIVIVKNDNLKKGDQEYRLACGKILWSKQKDVDSGESGVLVSIRSTHNRETQAFCQ